MTNHRTKWLSIELLALVGAFSAHGVSDARVPNGFFTDVRNVSALDARGAFDFIPTVSPDGLTLYFSDTSTNNPPIPGNHGEEDMWMATREGLTERFRNVVNLGEGVNTADFEDVGSVSPDGLKLYFGSNRSGNWDLYQAERRTTAEQFGNVKSLGDGVNTDALENSPRVSPDGSTLVFHRDDAGDHDIWMATRNSTDQLFGPARRLEMNSEFDDWWPSLSSDGLTLFHSDWVFRPPRPGGEGGEDLWVSTRPTENAPFGPPINLDELWPGSEINSSIRAGAPYISPDWPADGAQLYWTAQGPGGLSGNVDIFQATWVSIEVLEAGDADQDGDFDQLDLVQVQIAGKYLSGQSATWGEGDWNAAPGGEPGNPPVGDGVFDQFDILNALGPGHYLTGPYFALQPGGTRPDEQLSVIYNAGTGEVAINSSVRSELTSINIVSAAGIFTGEPAQNLGGVFDNDADNNVFKATFGGSFGSMSFGSVAQAGLHQEFLLSDLSVLGSLAGGGSLGDVDLVYVPEPSTILLLLAALSGLVRLQIPARD